MTRVSILLLSLCSFLVCLCHAQAGFELSLPLRKTFLPAGLRQSPIEFDLDCMSTAFYKRGLEYDYVPASAELVVSHSSTLQVSFTSPAGSFVDNRRRRFFLQQLHFHSPPEHTFKEYPKLCDRRDSEGLNRPESEEFVLEMHLVHQRKNHPRDTAVIGVLFKLGERSEFLDQFWEHVSDIEENESVEVDEVDLDDLELSDKFIQYSGSLTTQPYTEGVQWTVSCGNWNTLSRKQLMKLRRRFPDPNNRETQPWNGREVSINFPMYNTIEQKTPSLVQSS